MGEWLVQQSGTRKHDVIRLLQYVAIRLITLMVMVFVSVCLTMIAANMGGYVDRVVEADLSLAIGTAMFNDPATKNLTSEQREQLLDQMVKAAMAAQGMNQPFLLRTIRWSVRALTLDWSYSRLPSVYFAGRYTRTVRAHILDSLPRTLLLFGPANLLLFGISLIGALALTHVQGGWLDRLIVILSPLSSVPPWVFGIFLIVLALQVPGLRFMIVRLGAWPTKFEWSFVPLILRYMLLPLLSILLSKFFQSVFAWRTFFLLHYNEDYVTLAKAKGVPPRLLESRYILRPTLPAILTNFALLLVSVWQEVIVLEHFFDVEGIGKLLVKALVTNDTGVILASVVVFAYLLAITIFFLDIACVLVDPRLGVGIQSRLEVRLAKRTPHWPVLPRLVWMQPRRFNPGVYALRPGDLLYSGIQRIRQWGRDLARLGRDLARYPSALVGLGVIAALIVVAVYAVIAIPYPRAVTLWRGDQQDVYHHPKNVPPVWVDIFTRDRLPRTLILDSRIESFDRRITKISPEITDLTIIVPFEYAYDRFPQELAVYLYTAAAEHTLHISQSWHTPDGREIHLGEMMLQNTGVYRFAHDKSLLRRLDGVMPEVALFADPSASRPVPLKGRYELEINGLMFEKNEELDAEFIIYGQVYGLAGTDSSRRDLMTAVLWGTAVALSFGLLAAVGATVCTLVLAAIGAWFGGWLDELLQRITEVNMVLPFLPVSLMIFTLYSKSFWVLLGVVVLLSIFGSALKTCRAVLIQTKLSSYVEAARAYGASDWRIIFIYLIPRIAPIMIPQFVILVPGYVFLESALAFLGLSDPNLPTWGRLINSAFSGNLFVGPYHLVLLPAVILLVTGLAFALVGYALERILNPHLREVL